MNLITLLLVAAGTIQLIGLVAFLLGVFRAPEGFQDSSGFHLAPGAGASKGPTAPAMIVLPHSQHDEDFGHAA